MLSPDEKKVIETIINNGYKIKQKQISEKLSWSKSKVSAVISNLE